MNLSQFNRILAQTLLLPVVALSLVAAILTWQVLAAQRTFASLRATNDTIAAASRAEALVVDEETGLRGFQITSNPLFLEPYRESEVPLHALFSVLRDNVSSDPEATRLVASAISAHETWEDTFAGPLIATVSAGGTTTDVELNLHGKERMDAVRARITALEAHESALRAEEVAHWNDRVRQTVQGLILLCLLAGVLISVFTFNRLHRVSAVYKGTLDGLRSHAQATFESEERLRTTLTSIGDGVVVCDPEGRVELLNTVAEELTGWKQAEALTKPLSDIFHIVHETTRQPVKNPVENVLVSKAVIGPSDHTLLVRRDGSEIHIDDSGAPILDRSGALSGIVMVFRDVTEQRQTQSALVATEKLATAGRLAATIAHEMHNPLDSVVNLLYLIRDEKDPTLSGHYLDLAQAELNRMGQVTRAMLGLYRESKAPVRIDVKEMLESVIVLLERQMKQSQVTLTTELPDGLEIAGYPAELRQVITNLIANAAEAASPHGHIIVSARASQPVGRGVSGISRPGAFITISDNGTGIQPDALNHIFEPFFTTKGERGTGLGLWVSRGIIDKHGGTIEIKSRTSETDPTHPEQHGTAITVFLPRISVGKPTTAHRG